MGQPGFDLLLLWSQFVEAGISQPVFHHDQRGGVMPGKLAAIGRRRRREQVMGDHEVGAGIESGEGVEFGGRGGQGQAVVFCGASLTSARAKKLPRVISRPFIASG